MAERDPRKDPRPGDVLCLAGGDEVVVSACRFAPTSGGMGAQLTVFFEDNSYCAFKEIHDAEVLHVAD